MAVTDSDDLDDWLARRGSQRFLEQLRQRLVRNGGTRTDLTFSPALSVDEQDDLIRLFGNSGAVRPDRVLLQRAETTVIQSRLGLTLRDLVERVYGQIVTRTQELAAKNARNEQRVTADRQQLLDIMRPVPQLTHEYNLLDAMPAGATRRVPLGTATGARSWSSYSFALQAAARFWPRYDADQETWKGGLGASGLGGAKRWTDARIVAFQNLVEKPFDQVVRIADTSIHLRGPLRWTLNGDVVFDAQRIRPWGGIPARGVLELGNLEGDAAGVILVENKESFQQVCEIDDVVDRWLCVWVSGFPTNGLIDFVRQFHGLPIVAWCDLDPSGIEIVGDTERRLGFEVRPVGMDVELWSAATKRDDTAAARACWQARSKRLAKSGPPRLRELARHLARDGERVEQEALEVADRVLPALARHLQEILEAAGAELHVMEVVSSANPRSTRSVESVQRQADTG